MVAHRSYVFYVLNAVRALSIIALLLVFASSIVMMVEDVKAVNEFVNDQQTTNTSIFDSDYIEGSTVPNQPAGIFWAIVNWLLIIFQVIILILAEVEWPMIFFTRFFPVLGSDSGLGALGIFQSLIGAAILSHHVDEFSLVSAIFLFSIGCLNMTLGLIFRESAKSKRSFHPESSKFSLPLHSEFASTPSFLNEKIQIHNDRFSGGSGYKVDRSGYGFGRQGEKHAGLKGYILTKPEEALPRYAPKAPSEHAHSVHSASRRNSTHSESHKETDHEHHESEEAEEEKEQVTPPRTESPTPVGPKFKSSETAL